MNLRQLLGNNRGVGPGFHFLRHFLAIVILVHHCRIAFQGVSGSSDYHKGASLTMSVASSLTNSQLLVEILRPFLFALVGGFFALSGFLIAGSAARNDRIWVFFANRALRIVPALSVEVTLSALILGPLVTIVPLTMYFTDASFFRYFGNILGFVTYELPGVFTNNPWPKMVNANLWTLPPEFWCYAVMLLIMPLGVFSKPARISVAVIIFIVLLSALNTYDPITYDIRTDSTHFTSFYIVLMFFLGVLLFVNAGRVPISLMLFVSSAVIYYLITLFRHFEPLSGVFLAYCTVYVGMPSFSWFDRVVKVDLSYGIYLYGFPITQTVVMVTKHYLSSVNFLVGFVITLLIVLFFTILFSYLSWTYIEKPMLGMRKYVLGRPKASSEITSPTT